MKLAHGFLAAGSASALIDAVPLTGNCAVDEVTMKEVGMNFDCQEGLKVKMNAVSIMNLKLNFIREKNSINSFPSLLVPMALSM
jgi:hypothetical protein